MFEPIFAVALLGVFAFVFVAKPVYDYVRDPKGFRRFPGMTPLAPFTNIPYMLATVRLERFKVLHEAHKKHPIVRVGPNSISFNDADAVRDIHGHGTLALKDHFYDILSGTHRHLADSHDREEHSRKRRTLAAAYALSSIVHWEHVVADRLRVLVEQYDKRCVAPDITEKYLSPNYVNHRHWMNLFGIDAINEIGLSAGLRLLENADDIVEIQNLDGKRYKCHYRASLWYSHRIQSCIAWSSQWFPLLAKLTSWHPWWTYNQQYTDMVIWQCRRRLARYEAGEKLDDFFSFLLHNKYGKANMLPMGELIAECSIMMNAGSDTTSVALTNVTYHLIKNPSCLSKLRHELSSVLSASETDETGVIPWDKVKHLPYLRACLDESLRLTPPNTMNVPRLTPPQGMSIMGEWIPGDTTVHTPPYSMHRNAAVFPDPEAYRPERWLQPDSKDLQPHFITFSAGPRGCIGKNITYFEQTVALATLVNRYDFRLPHQEWTLEQREAFTCSPGDMPVLISRRGLEDDRPC